MKYIHKLTKSGKELCLDKMTDDAVVITRSDMFDTSEHCDIDEKGFTIDNELNDKNSINAHVFLRTEHYFVTS